MKNGALLALFVVAALLMSLSSIGGSQMATPEYRYSGATFFSFVRDSYADGSRGDPKQFFKWFEGAYSSGGVKLFPGLQLRESLAKERRIYKAIKATKSRAIEELRVAGVLYKMVKRSIPKFSLDRGFEFYYTQMLGERQCFLQSVLIAGMMQEIGFNAGVVMVYRNIQGQPSNNGHAVALLKLSDGKDIIVDASDPIPFVEHKGLFAKTSDYIYLVPVYEKKTSKIIAYRRASDAGSVPVSSVGTMDVAFLQSQFDYYRGERAAGGIIAQGKTKKGLERSARYFLRGVKECPQNPLAVYMLGRTYMSLGNQKMAYDRIQGAYKLYRRFGWVPDGVIDAMSSVGGKQPTNRTR